MITDTASSGYNAALRKVQDDIKNLKANDSVQDADIKKLEEDIKSLYAFNEDPHFNRATIDELLFESVQGIIKPIRTIENGLFTEQVIPIAVLGKADIKQYVPTLPVSGILNTTEDVQDIVEGPPVPVNGYVDGNYETEGINGDLPAILMLSITSSDNTFKGKYLIDWTSKSIAVTTYSQTYSLIKTIKTNTTADGSVILSLVVTDTSYEAQNGKATSDSRIFFSGQWINCTPLSNGHSGIENVLSEVNLLETNGTAFSRLSIGDTSYDNLDVNNLKVHEFIDANEGHFNNLVANNLSIDRVITTPVRFTTEVDTDIEFIVSSSLEHTAQQMIMHVGAYSLDQTEEDEDGNIVVKHGEEPKQATIWTHSLDRDNFTNSSNHLFYDTMHRQSEGELKRYFSSLKACHLEIIVYGNASLSIETAVIPENAEIIELTAGFQAVDLSATNINTGTITSDDMTSTNGTISDLNVNNLNVSLTAIFEQDAIMNNVAIAEANIENNRVRHTFHEHNISEPSHHIFNDTMDLASGWTKIIDSRYSGTLILDNHDSSISLRVEKANGKLSISGNKGPFINTAVKDGDLYILNNGIDTISMSVYSDEGLIGIENDDEEAINVFPGTPSPVLVWDSIYGVPCEILLGNTTVNDLYVTGSLSGPGIEATEKITLTHNDLPGTYGTTSFDKKDNIDNKDYFDIKTETTEATPDADVSVNRIALNGVPLTVDKIATVNNTSIDNPEAMTGAEINVDTNHTEDGNILDLINENAEEGRLLVNGKRVDFQPERLEIKSDSETVTYNFTNGPYNLHQTSAVEMYGRVLAFDGTTPGKAILFDEFANVIEFDNCNNILAHENKINIMHIIDPDGRDVGYLINSEHPTDANNDSPISTVAASCNYIFYPNPKLTVAKITDAQPWINITLPVGSPLVEKGFSHLITGITRSGEDVQHTGFQDNSKAVYHSYYIRNSVRIPSLSDYTLCLENGYFQGVNQDSVIDSDTYTYTPNSDFFSYCYEFEAWEAARNPYSESETHRMRDGRKWHLDADGNAIDDTSIEGLNIEYKRPSLSTGSSFDEVYECKGSSLSYLAGENNRSLHGTVIFNGTNNVEVASAINLVIWPDGKNAIHSIAPALGTDGRKPIEGVGISGDYSIKSFKPIHSGPMKGKRVFIETYNSLLTNHTVLIMPALNEGDYTENRIQNIFYYSQNGLIKWPDIASSTPMSSMIESAIIGNRLMLYAHSEANTVPQYVNLDDISPSASREDISYTKYPWGTCVIKSDALYCTNGIGNPSHNLYRGGDSSIEDAFIGSLMTLGGLEYSNGKVNGIENPDLKGWLIKHDNIPQATDTVNTTAVFMPDNTNIRPYMIPYGEDGTRNTVIVPGTNPYITSDRGVTENGFSKYKTMIIQSTSTTKCGILPKSVPDSDGAHRFRGALLTTSGGPAGTISPLDNGDLLYVHSSSTADNMIFGADDLSLKTTFPAITGQKHQDAIILKDASATAIAVGQIGYLYYINNTASRLQQWTVNRTVTSYQLKSNVVNQGTGYDYDDLCTVTINNVDYEVQLAHEVPARYNRNAVITSPGTGYSVGDVFKLNSTQSVQHQLYVSGVDENGGILTFSEGTTWTTIDPTGDTMVPVSVTGTGAIIHVDNQEIFRIKTNSFNPPLPTDVSITGTYDVISPSGNGMTVLIESVPVATYSVVSSDWTSPNNMSCATLLKGPDPNEFYYTGRGNYSVVGRFKIGDTTRNATFSYADSSWTSRFVNIGDPNSNKWGPYIAVYDSTYSTGNTQNVATVLYQDDITKEIKLVTYPMHYTNLLNIEYAGKDKDGKLRWIGYANTAGFPSDNAIGDDVIGIVYDPKRELDGVNKVIDVYSYGRTAEQTAARAGIRADLNPGADQGATNVFTGFGGWYDNEDGYRHRLKAVQWTNTTSTRINFSKMISNSDFRTGGPTKWTPFIHNCPVVSLLISYINSKKLCVIEPMPGQPDKDSILANTNDYGGFIIKNNWQAAPDVYNTSSSQSWKGGKTATVFGDNAYFPITSILVVDTIETTHLTGRRKGQRALNTSGTSTQIEGSSTTKELYQSNVRVFDNAIVTSLIGRTSSSNRAEMPILLTLNYRKRVDPVATDYWNNFLNGLILPKWDDLTYFPEIPNRFGVHNTNNQVVEGYCRSSFNQIKQSPTSTAPVHWAPSDDSFLYTDYANSVIDSSIGADFGHGQSLPAKADSKWGFFYNGFTDNAGNEHVIFFNKDTNKVTKYPLPMGEKITRMAGNLGALDVYGDTKHYRITMGDNTFSWTDYTNDLPPIPNSLMTVWLDEYNMADFLSTDNNSLTVQSATGYSTYYDDKPYNKINFVDMALKGRTSVDSITAKTEVFSPYVKAATVNTSTLYLNGYQITIDLGGV